MKTLGSIAAAFVGALFVGAVQHCADVWKDVQLARLRFARDDSERRLKAQREDEERQREERKKARTN